MEEKAGCSRSKCKTVEQEKADPQTSCRSLPKPQSTPVQSETPSHKKLAGQLEGNPKVKEKSHLRETPAQEGPRNRKGNSPDSVGKSTVAGSTDRNHSLNPPVSSTSSISIADTSEDP